MRNDDLSVRHAVVIASGGLDSTTLAYWIKDHGVRRLTLLSVDYGQRHRTELAYVARTAQLLKAWNVRLDLRGMAPVLAGSALTDPDVSVPDGDYTDESMAMTVVPNRNALLLDLAVALAVSAQAELVAFGAHAGDHAVYPDCRPGFIEAYQRTAKIANDGFLPDGFRVAAPFLDFRKADIVRLGVQLGVPFAQTWSCYRGGQKHCGRCGTCTERKAAFVEADTFDPTDYEG
jgi:7-cyano-7-deazaguanine synthase